MPLRGDEHPNHLDLSSYIGTQISFGLASNLDGIARSLQAGIPMLEYTIKVRFDGRNGAITIMDRTEIMGGEIQASYSYGQDGSMVSPEAQSFMQTTRPAPPPPLPPAPPAPQGWPPPPPPPAPPVNPSDPMLAPPPPTFQAPYAHLYVNEAGQPMFERYPGEHQSPPGSPAAAPALTPEQLTAYRQAAAAPPTPEHLRVPITRQELIDDR